MPAYYGAIQGGFVPAPTYWWDSRVTANTTQASNLVTAWRDTRLNLSLTNTGGVTRPDYVASNANLNGLPTIGTGVQTSQLVQCASTAFTLAIPWTILLLAWWVNPGGASNHYAFDAGSGASQRALFMTSAVANGFIQGGTSGTNLTTPSLFSAVKAVVAVTFNSGAQKLYFNSYSTPSNNGGTGTVAFTGGLSGFTFGNYLGGGAFAGGVQASQIMIVPSELAGAPLRDYVQYLAAIGNCVVS